MKMLLMFVTVLLACLVRAEEFPKVTLEKGGVSIDLYLPDAKAGFYRGLRYDHGGMVAQARWKGHTFFGEIARPHDPEFHDHGAGTVEEFGMTLTPPLGFAEAKAGEGFLKIGVGLLEKIKDKDAYYFAGKYKVLEMPAWKVKTEKESVEFAQSAASPAGLSYDYFKRVEVTETGFRIVHRLKNTGKAKWATDHYGHNYIVIDDRPIGPEYRVGLAYAAKLEEQNGIKADLVHGALVLPKVLDKKETSWNRVSGFGESADHNLVKVDNSVAKVGVQIATDLAPKRFVLYAASTVICPETFVQISLEPGESKEWTTSYSFFESK